MPALNTTALALALLATATVLVAQRRIAPDTLDDASRLDGVKWVLAVGSLLVLQADGVQFGTPVPTPFEVLVAYFFSVAAIGAPHALDGAYDLKPEDGFNPIEDARSFGERAYFVASYLPTVVIVYALPFAAFPGTPALGGALAVAVGFVTHLRVGVPWAAARSIRTAAMAGVFYFVLVHGFGGLASAIASVTLAFGLYVAANLWRKRVRTRNAEPRAT